MKSGFIYLLLSVFLLFIVENKNYADFQQDSGFQNVSSHSVSKKHRLNQTFDKFSSQHNDASNISYETEDDDFQISDVFQAAVVIAAISAFGVLLDLLYRRYSKTVFYYFAVFHTVKKFILIRSIRI